MRSCIGKMRIIRSRRAHFPWACCASAIVVVLTSCAPDIVQVAPTARRTDAVATSVSLADTSWNAVDADILVHFERKYPRSPGTIPDLAVHFARQLTTDGVLKTTLTVAPRRVLGNSPLPPNRYVSKIENRSDEDVVHVFDGNGKELRADAQAGNALLDALHKIAPSPQGKHGDSPAAGMRPKKPSRPREWADAFVVTDASAARMRASLRSAFVQSSGRVRGHEQYLKRFGSRVTEALLDPDTGALLESNESDAGLDVVHTKHEYASQSDGRLLRIRTRTERLVPGTQFWNATVVDFSNVHFSRKD